MESGGRKEILMLVPVIFLVLPSIVMLVLYPGLMSLDLFVP
jgi:tight adherence protein C